MMLTRMQRAYREGRNPEGVSRSLVGVDLFYGEQELDLLVAMHNGALDEAVKQEKYYNDHNQAEYASRGIAPIAAIRPNRRGTEKR